MSCSYDLDHNGVINAADMLLWVAPYKNHTSNEACVPVPSVSVPATPVSPPRTGDGSLAGRR